mgnify:FL=1
MSTIISVLLYLLVIGYIGYRGFRDTKNASDFMIAGGKMHPFVMALSYGATFISTSAIVGFGGVAGLFGMSLLWLTFLNIFVGIFIAFVFLGAPTRRMGHHLDVHTFPELLGKRYKSRFIHVFAGLIIFLFIPLYSAAVLIGGCEFIATKFAVNYNVALLVFSCIIAAYVVMGGLKGVMYTDALQGAVMFIGMVILLGAVYVKLGGVSAAHESLADLAPMVPGKLKAIGHDGWTAFPQAGFGDIKYNLWWIVVSTITLGVGIGVLAQPQLVVRFMTVRGRKELNRAVFAGGVFILIMTGVAFTVGSLSNAYFATQGPVFTGKILKTLDEDRNQYVMHLMKQTETGEWMLVPDKKLPVKLDGEQPYLDEPAMVDGEEIRVARGRSISIVLAKGNPDQIIPAYLTLAMPNWFGLVFLLTLLAAAMSTLSSQFHALGTSLGRDVFQELTGSHEHTILTTRIGIVIGILIAVIISYYARGGYIIARATAIFFGLCASAFLPAYVGGLFWKRITRAGALSSMVVGFLITAFWLLFVKAKEAAAIGLVQKVTGGKDSILADVPNWPVVDPIVIALPISIVVAVVVSLLTKPMDPDHVRFCFGGPKPADKEQ